MKALVFVAMLGLIALIFVMYWSGGSIFNKLFLGSKLTDKREQMNRTVSWSSNRSATEVIAHVKNELALTSEPALVTFKYTLRASSEHALVIVYGKKLADAFHLCVEAAPNSDGHTGRIYVPKFMEADGMPVHVDKMIALRERIVEALRSQGATFA